MMWEYYFTWWKENDPFEKLVNGRKKFDDWMVIPRNMALKLNEAVLRTLVAQFKDDE